MFFSSANELLNHGYRNINCYVIVYLNDFFTTKTNSNYLHRQSKFVTRKLLKKTFFSLMFCIFRFSYINNWPRNKSSIIINKKRLCKYLRSHMNEEEETDRWEKVKTSSLRRHRIWGTQGSNIFRYLQLHASLYTRQMGNTNCLISHTWDSS